MAKTKAQKEKIIEELTGKFNKMKSAVFTNYQGLKVLEIQELRKKLAQQKTDYLVVKNTLAKIALQKSNLKNLQIPSFNGPIAMAFGFEDEIMPVKIIDNFAKDHKSLKFLGGIMGKELLDKEQVKILAKIPSKQELIYKTVAILKTPVFRFVNVLSANLKNLVLVLKAISQKS